VTLRKHELGLPQVLEDGQAQDKVVSPVGQLRQSLWQFALDRRDVRQAFDLVSDGHVDQTQRCSFRCEPARNLGSIPTTEVGDRFSSDPAHLAADTPSGQPDSESVDNRQLGPLTK
jgi:hypothetical protein